MALFLAIVLSPLFSGEWRDNTSSLLLTTKNGWEKIALAKICTGLPFTAEFLPYGVQKVLALLHKTINIY